MREHQDLLEWVVVCDGIHKLRGPGVKGGDSKGGLIVRQSRKEVVLGAMADVSGRLKGGVHQSIGIVAHQEGVGRVGVPCPSNIGPSGGHIWIRPVHGGQCQLCKGHVESHLFHHGLIVGAGQGVEEVPGPTMVQVVHGVAVDVVKDVLRHNILEQVPLVPEVVAAADGHVPPGHLPCLLLKLIQPSCPNRYGIHLHQEEVRILALEWPSIHGFHDALEDSVGALHPMLVHGVAPAVILVLFRRQLRREVFDGGKAAGPIVRVVREDGFHFLHGLVGLLVLVEILAVDQNQVCHGLWRLGARSHLLPDLGGLHQHVHLGAG
mmetsp:Transcript_63635/g.149444  ORF Transcript_63635/g.149444 Transcript_63635/m.149444 type:complete len:321 (+) Transcript_63635:1838-2800(+)